MQLPRIKKQRVEPDVMAFSLSELSRSYGICERKLWQEVRQGRMAHTRIGRRILITKAQFDDYLRRNSIDPFDPMAKALEVLNRDASLQSAKASEKSLSAARKKAAKTCR